jgi:hypothetical protein
VSLGAENPQSRTNEICLFFDYEYGRMKCAKSPTFAGRWWQVPCNAAPAIKSGRDASLSYRASRRPNRNEFPITDRLDSTIAPAATMGFSTPARRQADARGVIAAFQAARAG